MLRDEIAKLNDMGLLDELLKDKSTDRNILWATNAYRHLGEAYSEDREITSNHITGKHSDVVTNRAQKEKNAKATRTKQYAEVFTPFWICKRMNDFLDEDWLDCVDEDENGDALEFREGRTWQDYVSSVRMEITCGEAPFLTSRYDVASGDDIPLSKRVGLLDRKLRTVGENTDSLEEWLKWVEVAFQSTYGYEFQGDNLLIARINLLMAFEDNFAAKWGRPPEKDQYARIIEIIVWNIWQMDGLTNCVPYSEPEKDVEQITLDNLFGAGDGKECLPCKIYDWKNGKIIKYSTILKRSSKMKFDYIIGNPPYQEEVENNGRKNPIYNLFMDESYKAADVVELITPARFLFNAGQTPKDWNKKMLKDEHLKILYYEPDGAKIFPNTDIMGGVAISYHDVEKKFEPVNTFTSFNELSAILCKVRKVDHDLTSNLSDIISYRGQYRLTDDFFEYYPFAPDRLGSGTGNMVVSNIFEKIPEAFTADKPDDGCEYIKILGRISSKRVYRYCKKSYIIENDFLSTYNVFVPEGNGSGAIGEVTSTPLIGDPLIGEPYVGATDTFLSIGKFTSKKEAESCMKYVKTKFARTMLGILKATQHNPRYVWQYVPLQDFTDASDIDWSKSVSEIDEQLYKKYDLSDEEIEFIESHVKEME